MSKDNLHGEIHDYEVRVWDGDLFIKGEKINLWLGKNGGGLQLNCHEDSDEYHSVLLICKEIKEKFMQLDNLINQ